LDTCHWQQGEGGITWGRACIIEKTTLARRLVLIYSVVDPLTRTSLSSHNTQTAFAHEHARTHAHARTRARQRLNHHHHHHHNNNNNNNNNNN
jgi:hypothetical protein